MTIQSIGSSGTGAPTPGQIDAGLDASAEPLTPARVSLLADQPDQPAFEELGLSTARHILRLHQGTMADAGDPLQAPRLLLQWPDQGG